MDSNSQVDSRITGITNLFRQVIDDGGQTSAND